MKTIKTPNPNDLAKDHLNKIELSQSFILAVNYGGRIDVVKKCDLFQGTGLVEVLRHHILKSLQVDPEQK